MICNGAPSRRVAPATAPCDRTGRDKDRRHLTYVKAAIRSVSILSDLGDRPIEGGFFQRRDGEQPALAASTATKCRLPRPAAIRLNAAMRPQKIAFGEMRSGGGPTGILVYCADYRCSHSMVMSADPWADDVRLSDIEPQFVCKACGKRGADVRPHFQPARMRTR